MKFLIPRWVLIWAGLMAIIPIVFGIVGYVNPDGIYGDDVTAVGREILGGPGGFHTGRNMATGVVTLFAIWRKSAPMLITVLVLRIITDIFDVINSIVGDATKPPLLIFATILIGGSALAIKALLPDPTSTFGTS